MKTNRLELRLTDEERDLDASAAAAVGETLSEFFRQAARNRAVQIIDEQRAISLDEAQARRFLEALEEPDPETIQRLETCGIVPPSASESDRPLRPGRP